MWTRFLPVMIMVLLAACARHKPEVAAIPTQEAKDTFVNCTWGKVEGKALSIWSFACPAGSGSVKLVADDSVGGFDLVSDAPENPSKNVVIRSFAKAANAPLEAILPAVLAGTGKHDASCALVEQPPVDWLTGKIYDLEPTGAEKAAYDKANAIEPQDPPCGDYGISYVGDRFFKVLEGDPTRVVYLDMGSEIQIFDATTLKPVK